jgi:signal transduction histidine kinase
MSGPNVQGHPLPAFEPISRKSFQQLLEISTRLSSTLHLDELLSLVMEVATELTATQRASILLVDRKTGMLQFAASTGRHVPADIDVPLDNSIAGWVVCNGRPVISSDVQSDDRFYATVDQKLGLVTRTMLAVPLIANGKVIGALEVLNKQDDAAYTGHDVALMEALASQSAVAIMNASIFNQSDLLAEIMHEVRTPLMAISAASELLKRPSLPKDKQGDLINMIRRESQRLSKMTGDFLEFARLESGRERLAMEHVDLAAVISEVAQMGHSQAVERNISIELDLPDDLLAAADEMTLIGDSNRLKQVFLNLVSNATKYNVDNGRIVISAERVGREVRVSVADTGLGIGDEDVEHLFERFYRIPGSEKVSEGSGMGLAIAKKIVDEHNGRVEVSSALGEGSTFTVCLPLSTGA